MSNEGKPGLLGRLMASAGLAAVAVGASAPQAEALVTPDTRTPAQAVDTQNTRPSWVGLGIRNEAGNSGGTCTGLLINPRTVLFAAHCVDGLAPGAYDAPTSAGNRAAVGYTTDPTFGTNNLRNWLFGLDFGIQPGFDGRVMNDSVFVWYDPRSRGGPVRPANDGTFLPADVAIAGFANPNELLGRDARNAIGLLFSPITGQVPVTIGGYGQSGTDPGTTRASDFQRRLGTNVLSFLGNQRDINIGFYGTPIANVTSPSTLTYQDMYWADFDDPLRATRPFFNGPGTTAINASTLDPDVFPGDATSLESNTAPGDSGSPLVTNAFGRDVSLGVLSQGSRFFFESLGNPNDNFIRTCANTNAGTSFTCMGSTSGWNPLFLFWDQIVVNNPYKYVTAAGGVREWTDPTTWTQEIDPIYFVLSGSTLVNGLPTTPALGVSSATPNVGTVRANPSPPALCAFTGTCPPTGGTSDPLPGAGDPVLQSIALPGQIGYAGTQINVVEAAPGAEDSADVGRNEFLLTGLNGVSQSASQEGLLVNMAANTANTLETIVPGTPDATANTTALWTSGTLIQVSSGALTGPGSTNFTPNNTLGTAGLQNSTRWFEVNLRSAGTLNLTAATVTIDRLNVRGVDSGLNIRSGARLNTEISSFVDAGLLNVDGTFAPRSLSVLGGTVRGAGTIISSGGVAVTGGTLSAGGLNTAGTLAIQGNVAFGGAGIFGVDFLSQTSADRLAITGGLTLGGGLAANFVGPYRPVFGDEWTIATTTTGITGAFTAFASNQGGLLIPELRTVGNNLVLRMNALPIRSVANPASGPQSKFAAALDELRGSSFGSLRDLYIAIDNSSPDQARALLEQLAPTDSLAGGQTLGLTSSAWFDGMRQRLSERYGLTFAGQGAAAPIQVASLEGDALNSILAGSMAAAADADSGSDVTKEWSFFSSVRRIEGDSAPTPTSGKGEIAATAFSIGADAQKGDFTVGAMGQFLDGDNTLRTSGSSFKTIQGGVFAAWRPEQGWFGEAAAALSRSKIETGRTVGAFRVKGETDVSALTISGTTGFTQSLGAISFAPSAGLEYIGGTIEGYIESGSPAALIIPERSVSSLIGRAGFTAFGDLGGEDGGAKIRPHISLGGAEQFDDSGDSVARARFAAAPGATIGVIQGIEPDERWFEYGAGVQVMLDEKFSFGVAYQATNGRKDLETKTVQISGRYTW